MSEPRRIVKIGSRNSELALIQSHYVLDKLKELNPDITFEIVSMMTKGDKVLNKPLPKIGEKSLFTRELEEALKEGKIDFAVHSLKDLPTTLPEGLVLGAVCRREDARDVVLVNNKFKGKTLSELPEKSIVGTSSLRRTAQLCRNYPQLVVENIRGNLNTRLRKLNDDENNYAAIVLAAAGVHRMGWSDKINQILNEENMLFAVGQGALGVECREGDEEILSLLETLHDFETSCCVIAERSFLRKLEGGCSAPVGVHSEYNDETIYFTGGVWSLDGKDELKIKEQFCFKDQNGGGDDEPARKMLHLDKKNFVGIVSGPFSATHLESAEKFGDMVANSLIKQGALKIMSTAKSIVLNSISKS